MWVVERMLEPLQMMIRRLLLTFTVCRWSTNTLGRGVTRGRLSCALVTVLTLKNCVLGTRVLWHLVRVLWLSVGTR